MDRSIVYVGQLPQDTDELNTNLFALYDSAFQNYATVGQVGPYVSGLACTPTAPASLQVNVGVGAIFNTAQVDATSYGSILTNTNTIVKMGILPTATTLSALTPPGTVGFSQVFLIQAQLQDIDAGSAVLSYFNSANPAQPFSGPANSGAAQFTQRTCRVVLQFKAGTPATTGTQTTPSADAGWVALWAITVANGDTQITSGKIAQIASAPFFPGLSTVPGAVQNNNWIYAGQDTGGANAYVITFGANQPIPASYTVGLRVLFKALTTNTGASTINVNGIGTANIRRANGVALSANDIVSGQLVELTYDGTNFQMTNYLGTGTATVNNTIVGLPYAADSGTQNAIIATFSPAITYTAGTTVAVKLANTITGACTINANGLGLKNVTLGDLSNPPYNLFVAGEVIVITYDGTQFQIVNTSAGMFYRRPTANYTIYVNTSTGSDTLYDGTAAAVGSGTAGPLKTIQKAVNVAFGYAPSQFNITISIAAGTYNESVATPSYAGPTLIIDGVAAANVTVNSGSASCFTVSGPNALTVKNVTVQNSGVYPFQGFVASQGATLNTVTCVSGVCSIVFEALSGATINPGNHTFNGSGYAVFYAGSGGNINLNTVTFTINTSISMSGSGAAFAFAGGGNIVINNVNPPTFVNPSFVSGNKFDVVANGVISANGLGINFLPGSVAGISATGGQALF